MGSVCGCLRADDFDEQSLRNNLVYRHCICFRCFIQPFCIAYISLSHRGEEQADSSSLPGTTSIASPMQASNSSESSLDTYRSPPMPLPYDADPRHCSLLCDGMCEKASSHTHDESEPRRRNNDSGLQTTGNVSKLNGSDYGGSKVCHPESSLKRLPVGVASDIAYIISSSEDEDVCPTCLEEYTLENPKIVAQCSHHFHLGCIYEWMERSETCPVCGKMMLFDETI
ncbi:E3 ubiquitin-protein ligase [Acorus gramineus]|uniref:RING-type E3 ubiquitin transferase n=1 Tax=Acorus gramineus TaxID=55184 RepID=A0AAV9AX91_ACOGR|nr:E3 ubiquitin-protein ligase [Acorus gramineus]